ncbi:5792_t:CDS:2 [Ambispora leptoticha]|uniref:CCR4-NOT transcription complex subunit 11 n=1 Tax=Ambispora leptoticha TaxID=144679 RepID=A0A9N9EWR1_9GLOM|nr:5792_t:CDS:2 [Ambispora leptoticha]
MEEFAAFQNLLYMVNETFENIASEFKTLVPEHKRFGAACALMAWLESGDLQAKARVVALYILYNLYNVVPIHQNPFLLLFLNIYKTLSSNYSYLKTNHELLVEFRVGKLILTDNGAKLGKKTVSDVFRQFSIAENLMFLGDQEVNIAKLEYYIETELDVRLPNKDDQIKQEISKPSSWAALNDMKSEEGAVITAPPIMPIMHHELQWLNPHGFIPEMEWDYNILADFSDRDEARFLMTKAIHRALTIPEEQFVLNQFEKDAKFVFHCNLSPEMLPDLIENNPRIAIEALLHLLSSHRIGQYLQVLVSSINVSRDSNTTDAVTRLRSSMEVVNRLATAWQLPPEFLHKYISNCIRACDESENQNIQYRQVRLVCLFLQSLISNNIIDINEYFIEIQAFSVQYSRIREAAGLLRSLAAFERPPVVEDMDWNGNNNNSSIVGIGKSEFVTQDDGQCKLS